MKAATAQFFQQNWQLAIDPERLVRDLSLAERKLVQIARALIDGAARLVVFDEPTAPWRRMRPVWSPPLSCACATRALPFCIFPTTSMR